MTLLVSSTMRLSLCHCALFGVGLMCTVGGAHAQAPLPSLLPAGPVATETRTVGAVPANAGRAPFVGATARHLLEAQASGRAAAPAQAVTGATASLSWKRYVDSFSHPIPEFFESRVGKKSSE